MSFLFKAPSMPTPPPLEMPKTEDVPSAEDAARQAAQMAVDDPRRRLSLLGTGITSITPGAGGVTLGQAPMAAAPSPLTQALGFGLMGADIYGRIFGNR